jgi:hypothetical protein
MENPFRRSVHIGWIEMIGHTVLDMDVTYYRFLPNVRL